MIKPTVEQVQEYMDERSFFELDQAEAFFDYHESGGWVIGKNKPMKSWKASIRTWIRNGKKWSKSDVTHKQPYQTHAQRTAEQAAKAYKAMESDDREGGFGTLC